MVGLNKYSYCQPGKPYMECRKMTKMCPFLRIPVMAPKWLSDKESACQCRRRGFDPWVKKSSWSRKWQPTPALLPWKFQCTEELGCCRGSCSPWSCKESDVMKHACTRLPSTLPRSSRVRRCLQLHLIPLSIHPTNATVWPFHASPYARNKTDKLPAPTQLYPLRQSKTISAHHPQASPAPKTQTAGGSVCHVDGMGGPSPPSAPLPAQLGLL